VSYLNGSEAGGVVAAVLLQNVSRGEAERAEAVQDGLLEACGPRRHHVDTHVYEDISTNNKLGLISASNKLGLIPAKNKLGLISASNKLGLISASKSLKASIFQETNNKKQNYMKKQYSISL